MDQTLFGRFARIQLLAGVIAATACAGPAAQPGARALTRAPLHQITKAIADGDITAESMVRAYLERIDTIDRAGPRLQSVLAVNPQALADAKRLDAERAAGKIRGPLHGAPLLIKDNIETADPVATTAGSLALAKNVTGRDAPLAAGLRAAGAIILGKTNLSEWANFRSSSSMSGWSGLGGQVRNPYVLDRSPCGSSSGSGAAAAAGLAAGTVGTETNGSIICPSSMNGIVGFKPTVGLVSQSLIVPVASSQDTAGPMTRSVRDSALMLGAMVNRPDALDYAAQLTKDALKGRRVGVLRFAVGKRPDVKAVFETALDVLRNAGAVLVEIEAYERPSTLWKDQLKVLRAEFKSTVNEYLAQTAPANSVRNLSAVIEFNRTQAPDRELFLFGQDTLVASNAEPALTDTAYLEALARIQTATRQDGIDKFLREHEVTILVAPSQNPAFVVDAVHGDLFPGGVGAGWMAAIAGYPHLTVPMGFVRGLPVGLSFMATAGEDAAVLTAGYAYETRRGSLPGPQYLPTAEKVPAIQSAMARPDTRN